MSSVTDKLQAHAPSDFFAAIGGGMVDGASAAVMGALALKIASEVEFLNFLLGFLPKEYQEHVAGTALAAVVLLVDFLGALPANAGWVKALALTSIRGNASGVASKFTVPLMRALFRARKGLEADGIEFPHPQPDAVPRQKTI